jgi:hypothetical protein
MHTHAHDAKLGAVPADRKSISQALAQEKNLVLIPGGIAEIFQTREQEEVALLKGRKGFVRLALRHGELTTPSCATVASDLSCNY